MGFDFTLIAPLLPSHCGFSFVFRCGVSFLVSSSVFLSMIVQQLVVILVFSQEGVLTVVLICICLMINDVEHSFTSVGNLYIFFGKMSI